MKRSFRKPGWDYGQTAIYLVTLCLKRRRHLLSKICDDNVRLTTAGETVRRCIELIPHYHPYATIDEYIIMPDHVHIILHFEQTEGSFGSGKFGPQRKNLSSVIRGLKAAVTSQLKSTHPDFAWQPSYDDQILYTQRALENARRYVINNPKNANTSKYRT